MFNRTRIQLTLWYLAIIMVVSFCFSATIYEMVSGEVERFAYAQRLRLERTQQLERQGLWISSPVPPPMSTFDTDLVIESKQRIVVLLLFVNGIVLFASGGLGYFLAGKTLEPIQDMVDEQSRFISDASHELRTPLTALKTAMEVALRDTNFSTKDARQLIEDNITDVNKLQLLSDQLLQLSQYQIPQKQLEKQPIDIQKVLEQAVHRIQILAREKNITIDFRAKSAIVNGDFQSLHDLIVILLDNAIKYSPVQSTITIYNENSDTKAILYVKDQGIGISDKDIPHIFDRFFRADAARNKNQTGGYGLGLSIAKKIVRLHKGSIKVVSELSKGSVFIIRLPLIKDEKNLSSSA